MYLYNEKHHHSYRGSDIGMKMYYNIGKSEFAGLKVQKIGLVVSGNAVFVCVPIIIFFFLPQMDLLY